MERKKILFSFVGKQDPYSQKNGEEGSILTLVRFLKPDHVFLFPSGKGPSENENEEDNTVKNAEQAKEQIQSFKTGLEVGIIPIFFQDPTDYQEILEKTRKEIQQILEKANPESLEIHLNFSSGTPQQKSAWLILAASRFFISPHKIWQVVEPRFQKDGIRVKEISIDFLEEEISFQRMLNLFQKNLFLSAKEEAESLSRLTTNLERRNKIRILAKLFEAYHLWDAIRYEEAKKQLIEILDEIKNIHGLGEFEAFIKKQIDALEGISQTPIETPLNLKDLYFNATRCFQKGEYADTLARFWRLYEGLLFYRLRKIFGIEPHNVQESTGEKKELVINFLKKADEKADDEKPDDEKPDDEKPDDGKPDDGKPDDGKPDSPLKISRSQAQDLLTEVLDDSELKKLLEERLPREIAGVDSEETQRIKKCLKKMVDKRNISIVAHGMNPVEKKDAEKALKVARFLIERLVPEIKLEEPFFPQDLPERILRFLKF
ncbi:MAG: hypothetical protein NUV68_05785 [Caldiserica bacterium]|nr:hypothetical protein [Caldisericota bacterium]MDH7562836.1 hypothetical protein [Caldisericota bacterium]